MKQITKQQWQDWVQQSAHHCESLQLLGYCEEHGSFLFCDVDQNITIALSKSFLDTIPSLNE